MIYFQDMSRLGDLLQSLCMGSLTTIELFVLTILIALPEGFVLALGSISKRKPLKWVINVYILVMRGTPLMLQILFVYFGIGMLGIKIDRFVAAVLSITINYAAYFSEIFRGGIQSIEKGQFEAADMLGMTYGQTMRRIVLPQVFKRVLPSVGNEVINLVKDTALVYTIGLSELLHAGNIAMMRDSNIIPLVIAGVFYLVMNALVTKGLHWTESKFDYYR